MPIQSFRRKKTPLALNAILSAFRLTGFFPQADYFEAAGAAAAEAAGAAAASEAAGAAAAGAAASAAGAGAGAAAGAAASGAATGAGAAGASSFFEQAARATASRETISRDFFMGFSLINSKLNTIVAINNYR
ncbi:hypothetical protein KVP70_09355 [Duganella sp. HSC-15S17]|uniref:Type IV secretory pathway TrbL component n=1 Tax=Duganella violaceipulchra TaxID=2849652 RepID=A0AA41H805_9BURK|nr:hypothetical protein [Duganella violaceicalia]MBV6321140.1 hypothetical protein [Duganella violaceicalia]MCP2009615.1 type IV secretory pathway TrbL component [Duganella violaceicalia]